MLLTILVSAALIGIDQLLKVFMADRLIENGTQVLLPGVVGLRYIENDGMAFGMLAGKQTFLIVVTGIALLILAFMLLFKRPKDKLEYVALLMIFAGGVGNLIDRIANGFVVDYIELLFMNFAVFNFADCLVVVGVVLLIFAVIRSELKTKRKKDAEASDVQVKQADGES